MKNIPVILLLLSCLSGYTQTKIFDGSVGQEKIEMHLKITGKTVHGYYFYTSKTIPIALNGEIYGVQIKLSETDLVDTSIYFEGIYTGKNIIGKWHDVYKKTFLQFSASQKNTLANSFNSFIRDGHFVSATNSSLQSKECTIYYIDNNLFYYQFYVTNESCDGHIFGIGSLDKDNSGYNIPFANDNCTLDFTFNKSNVRIVEDACDAYHGARCTFDGIYLNK